MTEPTIPAHRFAVYVPDRVEPVLIDAENWVFALGTALDLIDRAEWVSRLSCEIHPDGTVVAEDRVTGVGYVVQRVREPGRQRKSGRSAHRSGSAGAAPSVDSSPVPAR